MLGRRKFISLGLGLASCAKTAIRYENADLLVYTVWLLIQDNYIDPTYNGQDWEKVREQALSRPLNTAREAYPIIRTLVGALDDPYTKFFDPATYANLQTQTQGVLSGVGFQELALTQNTQEIVIVTTVEGSPAQRAGIVPQDILESIDGRPTKGMALEQAGQYLRGKTGTTVTLTTLRQGSQPPKTYTLTRRPIQINPLETQRLGQLGYLRLRAFTSSSRAQVQQAIQTFEKQGVTGYILDLRGNAGGVAQSGEQVAALFLPAGSPIVTLRTRQSNARPVRAEGNPLTTHKLVVLVDGGTASASEICAAALQENQRALLVGSRTFGKGLVQRVYPLEDGSALSLSIARYQTPKGHDIHRVGIQPDRAVQRPPASLPSTKDLQFQAAFQLFT
jgi:carboxyl-terminal processing protease